jgi:uncharacterized membrane protein YhaH (DUF805 family)
MDFQAIFDNYKRTITEHYFDMTGRVGRAQFWYFVLANFIATLLAEIVGGILNAPIGEFYTLAVLFPATCLAARRLQDTGRNGMLAWALLILIAVTQIAGILMALSFFFVGFLGMLFLPGLSILGLLTLGVGVVLIWFWCQPSPVPTPMARCRRCSILSGPASSPENKNGADCSAPFSLVL